VAISNGGRVEFQRRDPERVEMRVPILVIKELPVGVLGQASDHVAGERTLVHGGQCLGIDDVVDVAGAAVADR
jgi:hypothetical protein